MKVLVLSDLHLGSKASQATRRLDAITRVAANFDRVILNGDTLDRCYVDPTTDEISMRLIADARSKCASRNGPAELLSGNHDPVISDTHWVFDEASETLIFHGDCILDYTHLTKRSDQELRAKLRERWEEIGGRPIDFCALHQQTRQVQRLHLPIINPYVNSKTALQYALYLIYPPRRPFDVIAYWMKAPMRALTTAKGFHRPIRRVVFGHTHRPGRWNFDGIDVFNTGSYMPFSGAFAICIEDTHVSHVAVDSLIASCRTTVALGSLETTSKLVEIQ